MKNTVSSWLRKVFSGENFPSQATFLPVGTARQAPRSGNFLPEVVDLAYILPVFNNQGKFLTVAQPLLKEACDEMR